MREDLDEKLTFKSEQKIDLGLKEPNRKVIHTGEVIRKSDNKLEWLDIHLILLDNFLIMTKKKRDRGVERFLVSKQVPLVSLQLN
jgi:RHO1 GDP-GTP exchange protein 1/2